MSIERVILRTLFPVVRYGFCYVVLGVTGALRHIWPQTLYLRWLVLAPIGMRNVDRGATAKAQRLAEELVVLSKKYKDDWYYGNAVHKGNLILGRVALRDGKIEAAKEYLLHAGMTPGSPQLDSFGPNMTLAKELLEAGEREVVLEFFKRCGGFWEVDFGALDTWAKIIQAGRVPDFGAHLDY